MPKVNSICLTLSYEMVLADAYNKLGIFIISQRKDEYQLHAVRGFMLTVMVSFLCEKLSDIPYFDTYHMRTAKAQTSRFSTEYLLLTVAHIK